jgi:capsule polysaccharide export protein KpsE/RkpR
MDNLILLYKKRWFIIGNSAFIAILSVIIALMLPVYFASNATLKTSSTSSASFLSMLSGLPMADMGFSNLNDELNQFISIIESRTFREHLVTSFDLVNRYEQTDIDRAIEKFGDYIQYEVTDYGYLKIRAIDRNPAFAKMLADTMLSLMDQMYKEMNQEENSYNRQALENRLRQNEKDLQDAQERLRDFQAKYGVVDIPAQTSAAIEVYSQIYAQMVAAEIELFTTRLNFSPEAIQVKNLEALVSNLDNKLQQLLNNPQSESPFVSFKKLPDYGLEYANLYREVEIQAKIMELLYPQYEQARMEEMKTVPSIIVLDYPKEPLHKFKPRRSLIVIGTSMAGFIFSLIFVYAFEFFKNLWLALKTQTGE